MPHGRDVIVVAASAGGLQPLRRILAALPASLPAAVVVVLHVPATGGRTLSRILDRSGPLGTDTAIDGERFRHGRVYVAPPDRHLLVVKDVLRLSCGPRQHSLRPAADPLFRSAALYARARTSAVVLSGTLDDAALGSAAVERCGGRVLIQDPAEADCDSMPRSAIAATKDPLVLPAADIAKHLIELASEGGPPEGDGRQAAMSAADQLGLDAELQAEVAARLSSTCADLPETHDGLAGHRYAQQSRFEEQSVSVEGALWLAVWALEERGRLATRLADTAREGRSSLSADRFDRTAIEARQAAEAIRRVAWESTAEVDPEPE